MSIRALTPNALTLAAAATLTPAALAVPVGTLFDDVQHCDPLAGPDECIELGTAPLFPTACLIDTVSTFTNTPACPADDASTPNALVSMTNLSGSAYSDVWYVAEDTTFFSNYDGTVNGVLAVRLDMAGINRSLFSESGVTNGVFEPGETWTFILDDYAGAAPADIINSIGVPSGVGISTGSIIALKVPTPGTASLLLAAGTLAVRRRRA